MSVNELFIDFVISAKELNSNEIQLLFGNSVTPDKSVSRGDKHPMGYPYPEGMWLLSTRNKLNSEDVNEHIKVLVNTLHPYQDSIVNYAQIHDGVIIGFHIIWKSSDLHSGSGPLISAECVKFISQFNAELIVDCYAID